jgi:methionine-S-sulfoxide reductase
MTATQGFSQNENQEVTVLGAGCFWCIEAVFQELKGVESVESGYMGGTVDNPTYRQVSTGTTGHAEVARIVYNSEIITFKEVLEVFWKTHDPTTLNRQGADVGTQYRSAVFYLNDSQKEEAEHYKERLNESGAFGSPVITEITKASTYYPAENYHQDYYALNPDQGYCRYVIQPKLDKFRKAFADKLKD